jgi:hypothetical protein
MQNFQITHKFTVPFDVEVEHLPRRFQRTRPLPAPVDCFHGTWQLANTLRSTQRSQNSYPVLHVGQLLFGGLFHTCHMPFCADSVAGGGDTPTDNFRGGRGPKPGFHHVHYRTRILSGTTK